MNTNEKKRQSHPECSAQNWKASSKVANQFGADFIEGEKIYNIMSLFDATPG